MMMMEEMLKVMPHFIIFFTASALKYLNLHEHLKKCVMAAKQKRSGGRKSNTQVHLFEDIKQAVTFIEAYSLTQGLLLPGWTPGIMKDGVVLLSSCETKHRILEAYLQACEQDGTFCLIVYALQQIHCY